MPVVNAPNKITTIMEHFEDGSPRANYTPFNNNMFNIQDYNDYIAELSHAIQFNGSQNLGLKTFSLLPGDVKFKIYNLKADGYQRPGHPEYNAHTIIEPVIDDYINYSQEDINSFYNNLRDRINRLGTSIKIKEEKSRNLRNLPKSQKRSFELKNGVAKFSNTFSKGGSLYIESKLIKKPKYIK